MKTATLKLFVETVRSGGFTAAAARQQIDPSSVSRQIAALEKDLGVRLFERSTRRFQPTEAGLLYYEFVAPLIEELDEAANRILDLRANPSGTVRVSTSVAFGVACIAPLLGTFCARYPDLNIDLRLDDQPVDFVHEKIDIAIRLGPAPGGDFVRARLFPVRHHVCASAEFLERQQRVEHPTALAKLNCVRFPFKGFNTQWHFRRGREKEIIVPITGKLIISNAIALKSTVLQGVGPGLLADWMIKKELEEGSLVDLFPDYQVTATDFETAAWLLYASRNYLPLKVRLTIEFLNEQLAKFT
ncbi:MAG: LysR substrate-binding domain-containing protein [Pseudomonadota bacterium]